MGYSAPDHLLDQILDIVHIIALLLRNIYNGK
jgi:hypothetical protein